jgi:hypothetical protein
MENQIAAMDWNDTFLNFDHLKSSFPGFTVRLKPLNSSMQPRPPFRFASVNFIISLMVHSQSADMFSGVLTQDNGRMMIL